MRPRRPEIPANGGAEEDARALLFVLVGKAAAQGGGPVPDGPEDAAAAGFAAGPSGERLHRTVWRLIASGHLQAVLKDAPATDEGRGAFYRVPPRGIPRRGT